MKIINTDKLFEEINNVGKIKGDIQPTMSYAAADAIKGARENEVKAKEVLEKKAEEVKGLDNTEELRLNGKKIERSEGSKKMHLEESLFTAIELNEDYDKRSIDDLRRSFFRNLVSSHEYEIDTNGDLELTNYNTGDSVGFHLSELENILSDEDYEDLLFDPKYDGEDEDELDESLTEEDRNNFEAAIYRNVLDLVRKYKKQGIALADVQDALEMTSYRFKDEKELNESNSKLEDDLWSKIYGELTMDGTQYKPEGGKSTRLNYGVGYSPMEVSVPGARDMRYEREGFDAIRVSKKAVLGIEPAKQVAKKYNLDTKETDRHLYIYIPESLQKRGDSVEDKAADVYAEAEEYYKGSEINADILMRVAKKYFEFTEDELKELEDYFLSKEKKYSEFLNESTLTRYCDTDAQEESIKKIERAANALGIKLRVGTKIGKYPQTVILDYRYQDNAIYIYDNGAFEIDGEEFGSWKDEYFDLDDIEIKDIKKALKALTAPKEESLNESMSDKVKKTTENFTKPHGQIMCNKGDQEKEVAELLTSNGYEVNISYPKKNSVAIKYTKKQVLNNSLEKSALNESISEEDKLNNLKVDEVLKVEVKPNHPFPEIIKYICIKRVSDDNYSIWNEDDEGNITNLIKYSTFENALHWLKKATEDSEVDEPLNEASSIKVLTYNFKPTGEEATTTYNKISEAGKLGQLQDLLDNMYPDVEQVEAEELNKLLSDKASWVLDMLDIHDDEQ